MAQRSESGPAGEGPPRATMSHTDRAIAAVSGAVTTSMLSMLPF